MRYSQSEKMEIIRLVERSELSVRRTLKQLGINPSTFYNWYKRYLDYGYDGLADKKPTPRKFWNKIPEDVKEHIVEVALEYPEKSPRELILENYYFPWELDKAIADFVEYYNNHRYHEALDNLKPVDIF